MTTLVNFYPTPVTQPQPNSNTSVVCTFFRYGLQVLATSNDGLFMGTGLTALGMAYFCDRHHYAIAQMLWQMASDLFDDMDDQPREATALQWAGIAAYHHGDDEQAMLHLEHARILYLVLENIKAEALTLTWLGHVYTRQQQTQMALCCYWDALFLR